MAEEYSSPSGIIPRLMAATHRWRQRGGRPPADVGSIPLGREPTPLELAKAAQTQGEIRVDEDPLANILQMIVDPKTMASKAMFMGAKALKAPTSRISQALELRAAGIPDRDIYMATQGSRGEPGISFGAEGQPRWEIEDYMSLAPGVREQMVSTLDTGQMLRAPLGDFITDKEIFENYPELARMLLSYTPQSTGRMRGFARTDPRGLEYSEINLVGDPTKFRPGLAHEIQHPIQRIEGFSPGGDFKKILDMLRDPAEAKAAYKNIPGEVEARNTADRLDLDLLTRALLHPEETEDVPRMLQRVWR